ncbi:MAG: hypothetical protein LBQ13_01710 [Endomicrobium sp.]|jgi:flagellar hook-basal body complex protein FliE|nr:hypothetical protein [Endomicrobium sp.]
MKLISKEVKCVIVALALSFIPVNVKRAEAGMIFLLPEFAESKSQFGKFLEKAAKDVEKTVKKAGKDIEKTAKKVGKDIEKTVKKVGEALDCIGVVVVVGIQFLMEF